MRYWWRRLNNSAEVNICLLLLAGWLFGSLTVKIAGGIRDWWFGPGIWKKRVGICTNALEQKKFYKLVAIGFSPQIPSAVAPCQELDIGPFRHTVASHRCLWRGKPGGR
jgi:hypothetical protein